MYNLDSAFSYRNKDLVRSYLRDCGALYAVGLCLVEYCTEYGMWKNFMRFVVQGCNETRLEEAFALYDEYEGKFEPGTIKNVNDHKAEFEQMLSHEPIPEGEAFSALRHAYIIHAEQLHPKSLLLLHNVCIEKGMLKKMPVKGGTLPKDRTHVLHGVDQVSNHGK